MILRANARARTGSARRPRGSVDGALRVRGGPCGTLIVQARGDSYNRPGMSRQRADACLGRRNPWGLSMICRRAVRPACGRQVRAAAAVCFIHFAAGCEIWRPPLPLPEAYEKGLVVMYPGSLNTTSEMVGFYEGLRSAGIDQAMEVVQWASFLDHMLDPAGAQERNGPRARQEADRLAAFRRMNPDLPITLFGYSGGCWFATLVAERLPADVTINRVILMSPAFDRAYDMTTALDRTSEGFVSFWSPGDDFTLEIRDIFSLADSTRGEPAATFGFPGDDPRLQQIAYDPAWEAYAHYGGHTDYVLLTDWIRDFVAPEVAVGAATE